MISLLLRAASACAISLSAGSAQAELLPVTQDSFADGLHPDNSNGTDTVLKVRGWDNTAFLQFDVSSLSGHAIASASLVIEVVEIRAGAGGAVEVRLVENAWSEDTLTVNNEPASSAALATVPINGADLGKTIGVDITDIVQDWVNGTIPNFGLALASSDPDKINVRLGTSSAEVHVRLASAEGYVSTPVELSWRPPSTRSDGTALSVGEIGGYILQMNGNVLSDDIPGEAVTVTVDILSPGEYCFKFATRDLENRIGPFSDAACWSVFPDPGPSAELAAVPISEVDVGSSINLNIMDAVRGRVDGTIPDYGLTLNSSDPDEINVRLASADVYVSTPVELSWRPPITRSDGTALSMGEIDGYILEMNGSVLSDDIPGESVTATVDILWPGEYCFKFATRDLENRIGPFSDATCWSVFPDPTPGG